MPRGDRRGPDGRGPMTGRAAGYCAGNSAPGFTSGGFGRGAGRGFRRGGGRGFGRFPQGAQGWGPGMGPAWGPADPEVYGPPSAQEEASGLRREASFLEEQLK